MVALFNSVTDYAVDDDADYGIGALLQLRREDR